MRAKHVLTSGRVTEALTEAGLFEGFPPDTPLPTIWRGLKYRRGLELEERRDLAETLMRTVVTATNGGTFEDVCEHLMPPDFVLERREARKEAEDMNTSVATLNMIRAFTAKWDAEHGE